VSEKKIPVRVDEGQYDALTQIKDDVGIPIAESVRRAIQEYLNKNFPMYKSSQPSGKHDSKFRTMVID
jgi:hypothetical protein